MIDDPTFEILYKNHYAMVFSFFRKWGFSREDTKDLTQEVFLRVYEKRGLYRGEATFRTWLDPVMRSVWKNHLRATQTKKRSAIEVSMEIFEGGHLASKHLSPAEQLLLNERVSKFQDVASKLPPGMRKCMTLRYLYGLKYREIADLLKLSLDTVKAQIHQGRIRMKSILEGKH